MQFGNIKEILSADPLDLLDWLTKNFTFEIPEDIDSEISMRIAGNLMGQIMNSYSFLSSLEAALAMHTKMLKMKIPVKGEADYENSKVASELMQLRKNAVSTYADILDKQYKCISRMLTVKIEADKELYMSDGK